MKRMILAVLGLILVVPGMVMAAVVEGQFYSLHYNPWDPVTGDYMEVPIVTRDFTYDAGDCGDECFLWSGLHLEFQLNPDVFERRMKAYFYFPRMFDDTDYPEGSPIFVHASSGRYTEGNTFEKTVEIETSSNRKLQKQFKKDCPTFRTSDHEFNSCNFTVYEVDFLPHAAALGLDAKSILTLRIDIGDGYFEAGFDQMTYDPYGILKAAIRLSDVPLKPMVYPDDIGTCGGKKPTIVGTHNDDMIYLSNQKGNVIKTFGGNDYVVGSQYADTICTGDGNDHARGEGGADYITGEGGSDLVFGGDGPDRIVDKKGSNSLSGGRDNDTITGNSTSVCKGDGGRDESQGCGLTVTIERVK